ncbi:glycine--tRNA ligase subunit beta [Sansalvadorimonas sp. 2012CJ34-2]|uniref:Glycine--tRNA ligase beta subunit n=1 Tax=Parendozoicomonas callyspongiae TaxID=2942213 RepID=A0ABT0PAZ5_9GAMM|nr:glycine--tRNA ligase subunit beta [Sansalvadorimonas sp. 2012CJ34-2]MCL6268550.1 glycine--tRNA ligase subunit beta [Sansalvadorimonas sp. 2012CJ34-2]
MSTQDFLVELGTEELPPKALRKLSNAFTSGIVTRLEMAGLKFSSYTPYAAPRRLALLINDLETSQPDKNSERRGPAVQAAFDADGNPTKACQGFARSCGVEVSKLERLETDKGAWLVYRSVEQGKSTKDLIPEIITASLDELPIPKRMRWGNKRTEFVRPAQWLVTLLGEEVVNCEILDLKSGRDSRGHRFHFNQNVTINKPSEYKSLLKDTGYVVVDYDDRRQTIQTQVKAEAEKLGGVAVIDEDLLDEVASLNEWPSALTGHFDEEFLEVPAEALVSSMKEHQKYFHVVDQKGQLMPYFITITNIESKKPSEVISGNEKVIRPRLADARFFFETDKRTTLNANREKLKPIVFQSILGSLYDKTERVALLSAFIAEQEDGNKDNAKRAGELCKSDLVSEMVLEFPELQGIMGMYYGRHDGEHDDVSRALNEQYMPRFAGDELPASLTGCSVAIADKIDTITGIFGIKQPPSGSKDPFALRRATLGVLRIIVEKKLNLDLRALINESIACYKEQGVDLPAGSDLADTVLDFMLDRFRAWYQDEKIAVEVFLAVRALKPSRPYDFDKRVRATAGFMELPEASALASANKRVSNILAKGGDMVIPDSVDSALLKEAAERDLDIALAECRSNVEPLLAAGEYNTAMNKLATLKNPVDTFFDQVMVNAEDEQVKLNRYALLKQLHNLFMHVADISLLQTS